VNPRTRSAYALIAEYRGLKGALLPIRHAFVEHSSPSTISRALIRRLSPAQLHAVMIFYQ
jgi:hypothetical protein